MLSGKYTGHLEVEVARVPSGDELSVTSLVRTLVDSTVRPLYAGGVPAVLKAFRLARNRPSVQKLLEFLTKLGFTYLQVRCLASLALIVRLALQHAVAEGSRPSGNY